MAGSWLRKTLDVIRAPRPVITVMPGARGFPALGVQVLNSQVLDMDGAVLGPLAGARVEVVDESGHTIYGAMTMNPLPTRQRGTIRTNRMGVAVVAFGDGSMHQKRCIGQQCIAARAEAVAFAAMAGT
jgi:hypothetical protein